MENFREPPLHKERIFHHQDASASVWRQRTRTALRTKGRARRITREGMARELHKLAYCALAVRSWLICLASCSFENGLMM